MDEIKTLFKRADQIKSEYEDHFKTAFPERILGWWDPLNIVSHPEELRAGVEQMENDVNAAISSNEPIEEMTQEEWERLIF